jgi:hypothetical protein
MIELICIFFTVNNNVTDYKCYTPADVYQIHYCAEQTPPPLTTSDPNGGFYYILGDNCIIAKGYYNRRHIIRDENRGDIPFASIFYAPEGFSDSFEPLPRNCRTENIRRNP